MKAKILLLQNVFIVLSLILAGCGKNDNQSGNTSTSSDQSTSLSDANQLLMGTLKLEGTNKAVNADEASQLLPLWQAYRSLSTSQTAAEAEVDGLLKQIQSAMSSAQIQAIKDMNLTNTEMMNLMQSMGGIGPQGTPNPNATPGFEVSGGFPLGGFVGGGSDNGPSFSTGEGSGGPTGNRPSGGGAIPGGGQVVIQVGPGVGGDAGSAAGLGGGQVLQGTPDPTMQARFVTQASQVNTVLLNVLISKLEALTNK
jgi:hypothetical protein